MRTTGELITTAQASELLGITVAWINKQAAKGRIPYVQKLPGRTGAYVFDREEIERLAATRTT
jgi:predicted DNA-binding transcriptional regulator AlpA